jgi:hypothetical protein
MSQTTLLAEYIGLYVTPELVGRAALLAQIAELMAQAGDEPLLIWLTGPGGIGKTRLLQKVLEETAPEPQIHVAQTLVDFYHIQTHTPNGLAEALYRALEPPFVMFQSYADERQKLNHMRVGGDVSGMGQQQQRVLEAFAMGMRTLAADKRTVLALDTTERLVYGSNQFPALKVEIAESWLWLEKVLVATTKTCVIMAGRPEAVPLLERLRVQSGLRVHEVVVEPLVPEDGVAYFDAVYEVALAMQSLTVAERIRNLDAGLRRRACQVAQGRPILLSAIVDLLLMPTARGVPEILQDPDAQLPTSVTAVETYVVARLVETPSIGDTILALGRAPKGVDAPLLALLLGIDEAKASQKLAEVRSLSFVKIRPADQRFFLHDEFYAMLKRHVYATPDDIPEAARAYQSIFAYYEQALSHCRRELADLYQPVVYEGRAQVDVQRIGEVQLQRVAILTEEIFYRLRYDPRRAFKRYYRYTREAILTRDTILDLQLQSEMQAFWHESDPNREQQNIKGLERSEVESHLAMRPIARAWANGLYLEVLERAQTVRSQLGERLGVNGEAILSCWEAYALIYLGTADHLRAAKENLDMTIERLKPRVALLQKTSGEADAALWRVRALLAFAYRLRGYWQWVRSALQEAAEDYRMAARLWRDISFEVELAVTLNDLGFVQSELGYTQDGRALVGEAQELRRRLGLYSYVGLSLNTLGAIETSEGSYSAAIEHCGRALSLFRALNNPRNASLALIALAEATRRYSMTELVTKADDKVAHLREARDYAQEALTIVREQTKERIREVHALIEIGCASRDWVRIRIKYPSSRDDVNRLIAESANALRTAAKLAGADILYRRVDAWVNLAWLGYYASREDLFHEGARNALEAVPASYRLNPQTGKPDIIAQEAMGQLWAQLGKLYTLYGHRTFDRYQRAGQLAQPEVLMEIAKDYTLAMRYHALYSPAHRDLHRTSEGIYETVRKLTPPQLTLFVDGLRQVEAQNHLGESELSAFLKRRALWQVA